MFENYLIRPLAAASFFLPLVLTTGCGGLPVATGGRMNPQPVADLGQTDMIAKADSLYELRPNDVIALQVFREPDLSVSSLQIGSDGTVSVPLLGRIVAGGKTPAQLAEAIHAGLSPNYLLHPNISVNVVEYGSHVVNVQGAVNTAGLYTFKPGLHLSGALALAGGVSRAAKMKQVVILRPDEQGLLIARFDYTAISQGAMVDPEILPNDRVIVGTSGLAQAYQDFLATAPILGVFARFVAY